MLKFAQNEEIFFAKYLWSILLERFVWDNWQGAIWGRGSNSLEGSYPGENNPGANCPGGILLRQLSVGNYLGLTVAGGSYTRGRQMSWRQFFLGGNYPGWKYPGSNCPGCNYVGAIVRFYYRLFPFLFFFSEGYFIGKIFFRRTEAVTWRCSVKKVL